MYAQAIVVSAFFPVIARGWSDKTSLTRTVGTPARLLLFAGTGGAIVGATTIPPLLDSLADGAYGNTPWVVLWLMITLPFIFLNRLAVQTLIAGKHASAQLLALASGFGGTAVALVLIPAFSAAGAAFGTLFSEVSIALIATLFLRRRSVPFPFLSIRLVPRAPSF